MLVYIYHSVFVGLTGFPVGDWLGVSSQCGPLSERSGQIEGSWNVTSRNLQV